jgi:hypothetical protein
MTNVTEFDLSYGMALFKNLYLTQSGMFMLRTNVKSLNTPEYDFNCMTRAIIVKPVWREISLLVNDVLPNFELVFNGDFDAYTIDQLEQFKAVVYNCFIERYNFSLFREFTVYKGSIRMNTGLVGTSEDMTSLATDLRTNGFSLDNDNINLTHAILLDLVIYSRSIVVDPPTGKVIDTTCSNVGPIVGVVLGVLGILIFIPLAAFILYRLMHKRAMAKKMVYPKKQRPNRLKRMSMYIINLGKQVTKSNREKYAEETTFM